MHCLGPSVVVGAAVVGAGVVGPAVDGAAVVVGAGDEEAVVTGSSVVSVEGVDSPPSIDTKHLEKKLIIFNDDVKWKT